MSYLNHDQIKSLANVLLEMSTSKSRIEGNEIEYGALDLSDAGVEEIKRCLAAQNYVVIRVKSFTMVVDRYFDGKFCVCLCDSSIEDDRIFNVDVFGDPRFGACSWIAHFNKPSPWKGENISFDTLVNIIRWLKMITSAFA